MQFFPTAVCSVTAWRHSRLRDHWVMALVGEEGAEGEVCILHSPGIAASPISLLSTGGVCGRSLTVGKILFTGRQICSLYLVLWLCGQKKRMHDWQIVRKVRHGTSLHYGQHLLNYLIWYTENFLLPHVILFKKIIATVYQAKTLFWLIKTMVFCDQF